MNENGTDEAFSVSGRDDSLLKILAGKMNFQFKYVDVARMCTPENNTQPGEFGLQMLQERVGNGISFVLCSNMRQGGICRSSVILS
jgi:hypothetical protein